MSRWWSKSWARLSTGDPQSMMSDFVFAFAGARFSDFDLGAVYDSAAC